MEGTETRHVSDGWGLDCRYRKWPENILRGRREAEEQGS